MARDRLTEIAERSALRVLETLACARTTRLLALDLTRVAREVTGALERRAVLRAHAQQGARNAMAYGLGLGCDAAAVHVHHHVELPLLLEHVEGLPHDHAQGLAREVVLGSATVDHDLALTGLEKHPCDRGLAAARSVVLAVDDRLRHLSSYLLLLKPRAARASGPRAGEPHRRTL